MSDFSHYLPKRLLIRAINSRFSGGNEGDKLVKRSDEPLDVAWAQEVLAQVEWSGSQLLGSVWSLVDWTSDLLRGATRDATEVYLPNGYYLLLTTVAPLSVLVRNKIDGVVVPNMSIVTGGTLTTEVSGLGVTATSVRTVAIQL